MNQLTSDEVDYEDEVKQRPTGGVSKSFCFSFIDLTKLITSAFFLIEDAHCSVPLMIQKELDFASFGRFQMRLFDQLCNSKVGQFWFFC